MHHCPHWKFKNLPWKMSTPIDLFQFDSSTTFFFTPPNQTKPSELLLTSFCFLSNLMYSFILDDQRLFYQFQNSKWILLIIIVYLFCIDDCYLHIERKFIFNKSIICIRWIEQLHRWCKTWGPATGNVDIPPKKERLRQIYINKVKRISSSSAMECGNVTAHMPWKSHKWTLSSKLDHGV